MTIGKEDVLVISRDHNCKVQYEGSAKKDDRRYFLTEWLTTRTESNKKCVIQPPETNIF